MADPRPDSIRVAIKPHVTLPAGLSRLLSRLRRRAAATTNSSHPGLEARETSEQPTRWRFAWAWSIGAVLLLGSCKVSKPPGPPTPPDPTPPSPICAAPELVTGCWHQPPGEGWQFIPEPAPPSSGCVIAGAPGPILPLHKPKLGPRVNAAMARLTGCTPGSRCIIVARPLDWQAAVAAELRREGLCAGQHTPTTDEIAASECPTCPQEGGHIYQGAGWDDPNATGTVVWFKELPGGLVPQEPPFIGAARPAYSPAGGVTPAPTPTPAPSPSPSPAPPVPPAGDCPFAPCPDRVWTEATLPDGWGRNEIGRARWKFNSSVYVGRYADNTAVVIRNEPFCASIGMSPMGDGQLRAACPMRPDSPKGSQLYNERVAIEHWISSGRVLEARNGAVCKLHPENPVMFELSGGNCRLCSVSKYPSLTPGAPPEPVCSDWY